MKTLLQPAGSGKTTALIRMAHDYNGYIVVKDRDRVRYVSVLADRLKLSINQPITFREFLAGKYYSNGVKKFYIDEAQELIKELAQGTPVEAITISL